MSVVCEYSVSSVLVDALLQTHVHKKAPRKAHHCVRTCQITGRGTVRVCTQKNNTRQDRKTVDERSVALTDGKKTIDGSGSTDDGGW